MGRYLLDTNIAMFLLRGEPDCMSRDVSAILEDPGNRLHASSVTAMELVQLYRLGRVSPKRYRTADAMVRAVEEEFYVRILPFGREHVRALSGLEASPGHRDPFDHAIIAHALAEGLSLVSSDRKFAAYRPQGLDFVPNEQ